jgi:hypothetical protein
MYWSLMNRGTRAASFGAPRRQRRVRVQKNFGFNRSRSPALVRGSHVPDTDPKSPRYAMFVSVWRRLPRALANAAGPWLARQIG